MSRFPYRPGVTSRMRLRGHDYSEPGLYFVTTCVNDWTHRFGDVVDDAFQPHAAGNMLVGLWTTMPDLFPGASLDTWCVMPNHFHAIIGIGVPDEVSPPYPTVSAILSWFKSASTVEYIRGVKRQGWPRYEKRLWLDGFHDHVIRNDRDLDRIRDYIESNAAQWRRDGFFGR